MTKTARSHTLPPKPKPVIVELSATPKKFLKKGVKASQGELVGCIYPYLETKKTSPKLDVCKNFDNTDFKPTLPDDAPITVVLFAGGGGIEAGMVQAGIRPVIAVEFDPTKPDLSRAIPSAHFVNAKTHHHNFNEYGCRIIQLTVQEVAQSGFLGFSRRLDYLHASPVCANASLAHTAKAGKGGETNDDLTAAIAIAEAIRQLQPRVFTLENVPRYQNSQS
ncbi:DNA cytosine methyltransferase [uncultured Nostoc sp.]|uniref:DNA cytosine methyltransferase n=1 Tax=uncultured Nostoc sp. TaxID=340711 RepID=UPI0035CC9327